MSEWWEVKKDDISFSNDGKEMHINFDHNKFGELYVSVNVEDVLQILLENELMQKPTGHTQDVCGDNAEISGCVAVRWIDLLS